MSTESVRSEARNAALEEAAQACIKVEQELHWSTKWCVEAIRALSPARVAEGDEYDQKSVDIIKNLSMLVRRLCYKHPNDKLTDQAMAYLRGEKLEGSILRDVHENELRK